MYAVIYWLGSDEVYPYLNENKTLKLFERLEEADRKAELVEAKAIYESGNENVEARVISIEGVKD